MVFRVAGTITLRDRILVDDPYVTVAGQTAPGDGVQVRIHPDTDDARRLVHVAAGGAISVDEDRLQSRVVRTGRPEVIDRVGAAEERHFQDLGIEYYRYAG